MQKCTLRLHLIRLEKRKDKREGGREMLNVEEEEKRILTLAISEPV